MENINMKPFTVEAMQYTSAVPNIRIYVDGKYKFTLWACELSVSQVQDLLSCDQERMLGAMEAVVANRKFDLRCLERLVTELKA